MDFELNVAHLMNTHRYSSTDNCRSIVPFGNTVQQYETRRVVFVFLKTTLLQSVLDFMLRFLTIVKINFD